MWRSGGGGGWWLRWFRRDERYVLKPSASSRQNSSFALRRQLDKVAQNWYKSNTNVTSDSNCNSMTHTVIQKWLPTHLLTYLSTYLPTHLLTHLPTHPPTHQPAPAHAHRQPTHANAHRQPAPAHAHRQPAPALANAQGWAGALGPLVGIGPDPLGTVGPWAWMFMCRCRLVGIVL